MAIQSLRQVRRNENVPVPASRRAVLSSNGVPSPLVSLVNDDASTTYAACHDVSRVRILSMRDDNWESQRMSLIQRASGFVTCRLM